MSMQEEKKKIDDILSKAKNVLITAHKQPDADAFGSTIAFKWYIDKYFPNVNSKILFSGQLGEIKDRYSFLQGSDWLGEVEDISSVIGEYDAVVFLDGSEVSRFTEYEENIDLSKIQSICIDHHVGEPGDFNYYFRDTTYASCSEIVCEILLSDEDLRDQLVSEAVFIGIYGDTGGFTYVNAERAKVFGTARRVVENGKLVLQNLLLPLVGIKEEHFILLKTLIANTKSVKPKGELPPLTYSYFNKKDIEGLTKDQINPGRASYISNYLRTIEGYNWGFVVTPIVKNKEYGLSFRSSPGSVNVQEIGKALNGGGHLFASGGSVFAKDFEMTDEEFEKLDGDRAAELVVERIEELFGDGAITLTSDI